MLRRVLVSAAFVALLAQPALASADTTVDAAMIPDSTYTVTVLQVIDGKHVKVRMQNGVDTVLTSGRPTVNFSRVKKNDQLKLSIAKGDVLVFLDLSNH